MSDIQIHLNGITLQEGDEVLIHLREEVDVLESQGLQEFLQGRFPGITFGIIGGVEGVIVQRAREDRETVSVPLSPPEQLEEINENLKKHR